MHSRIALLPGSNHHEHFTNRQDMCSYNFIQDDDGTFEAVFVGCDGCSQSTQSEVGAGLVANYAVERLTDRVHDMADPGSAYQVIHDLYDDIVIYLRGLIALQPYGATYLERLDEEQQGGRRFLLEPYDRLYSVYRWIGNHLLFTIVGAHISRMGVVGFQRGDGGYQVDDVLHVEDHRNVPPYIAYQFFPLQKLDEGQAYLQHKSELPPPGFTIHDYPQAKKVAVFSDGMPLERIHQVWELADPLMQWESRRNRLQKAARQWHRDGELNDDLFLGVFVLPEDDVDVDNT